MTRNIMSLTEVANTACDLHIEEKHWGARLISILRSQGVDVPSDLARAASRSFERIEDKWRFARQNSCFGGRSCARAMQATDLFVYAGGDGSITSGVVFGPQRTDWRCSHIHVVATVSGPMNSPLDTTGYLRFWVESPSGSYHAYSLDTPYIWSGGFSDQAVAEYTINALIPANASTAYANLHWEGDLSNVVAEFRAQILCLEADADDQITPIYQPS